MEQRRLRAPPGAAHLGGQDRRVPAGSEIPHPRPGEKILRGGGLSRGCPGRYPGNVPPAGPGAHRGGAAEKRRAHPPPHFARPRGRGQTGDGLGGGSLPARRGAVLPHGPVHPGGAAGRLPGAGQAPAPVGASRRPGLHGGPGAGGLCPGAGLQRGRLHPRLRPDGIVITALQKKDFFAGQGGLQTRPI